MTMRLTTITRQRESADHGPGWILGIVHTPAAMKTPRVIRLTQPIVPINRSRQRGPVGLEIADPAVSNGRVSASE